MELLFWLLIASIVFIYGGYALIIYPFINCDRNPDLNISISESEQLPTVSIIVAAFNEEDFIEKKIENSLNLDYPANKLRIIVVSDGSTDKTLAIVEQFKEIRSLHKPERNGKIHAIARAMENNQSDITVYTDANCMLNRAAILNIVKHFKDPRVGAVAGEKRICINKNSKSNAYGEGLYWKIESMLKKIDYSFYSVVGAAGELFAIRTNLYEPTEPDTILDDFMITLNINIKGFRTAYAPDAYAIENASSEASEEFKRKVRIASGGFQSVPRLFKKISPILLPRFTFLFYTHRVSRWYFAPFALITIFVINVILSISGSPIYDIIFVFQLIFYFLASAGHIFRNNTKGIRGILIPYYFIFMHIAILTGLWRYLRNNHDVKWQRVKREK